jgi:hypothetical protein
VDSELRDCRMMCRPRIFKAWVRVLICFLIASTIQPSLVLCFDHDVDAIVEYGLSKSLSCSASEVSLFHHPLDQTMPSMGAKSSSIGMALGSHRSTRGASLSRLLFTHSYATCPSVAHQDNSLSQSAHQNNSRHITIRTTVLLI